MFTIDLHQFFSVFASVVNFLFKGIPLEPAKDKDWLIHCIAGITFAIGVFNPAARAFLNLLDQDFARYLFFAICLMLALLPSCFAKRGGSEAAKPSYVLGNRKYNLLGIACLICPMEVMYRTIQNTIFFQMFYSIEIAQCLIPLCLWIALSYQYQEQRKEPELDYSPNLKWKGQVLNVIHLINTCFWSFLAGILLICYTLYCRIHHVPINLNAWHLLAFSMIPVFFYVVALNSHTYLYLLFLAAIPMILIYSIQWQSWSLLGPIMFYVRAIFFLAHYIIYATIVYSKEAPTSRSVRIAAGLSAACIFFCCICQTPGWLTQNCIIALSIPLIVVELHSILTKKPTSYQLALILTPAFLICIVNWTSSIVTIQYMAYRQAGFVIAHFFLYMLVIFCYITPRARRKPAVFSLSKLSAFTAKFIDNPSEAEDEAKENLAKKLLLGDYFFAVVFAVTILAYPIFCTLPFEMEQVDYNMAVNHINAICDSQQQAEELLSEIRGSSWYTDDPMLAQPEIDLTQYLAFMYSHLREKMVEKGVISSSDTEVTAKQLYKWHSEHSN